MKILKELVRLKDMLTVCGGVSSTKRGISMPDGSAVPVETIMLEFAVSREKAQEIAQRRSR